MINIKNWAIGFLVVIALAILLLVAGLVSASTPDQAARPMKRSQYNLYCVDGLTVMTFGTAAGFYKLSVEGKPIACEMK